MLAVEGLPHLQPVLKQFAAALAHTRQTKLVGVTEIEVMNIMHLLT